MTILIFSFKADLKLSMWFSFSMVESLSFSISGSIFNVKYLEGLGKFMLFILF